MHSSHIQFEWLWVNIYSCSRSCAHSFFVVNRLRCRCFADLTKPSQRLQRLIHSAPAEAGHLRGSLNAQEVPTPALRGEGQLTESSNISPKQAKEHLRELTLLVGLLPGHLRESLCLNPKFSQVSSSWADQVKLHSSSGHAQGLLVTPPCEWQRR